MKSVFLILASGFFLLLSSYKSSAQIGPEGNYITFNGKDQYLVIPHNSDLDISAGEDFTLTFRFSQDEFKSVATIFSKGNHDMPGGIFGLRLASDESGSRLAFELRNSMNRYLSHGGSPDIQAGKWLHFAWVYRTGDKSSRIFLNGVQIGCVIDSTIGSAPLQNGYDLLVGCGLSGVNRVQRTSFWPGRFDELRIWKRALSQNDLTADAKAAKPSPWGLISSYDFSNPNGFEALDALGNGTTGHLYGYGIKVVKTELPVGIGSQMERLTAIRITSRSGTEKLKNISLNLNGTSRLEDLTSVKVFYNGQDERFNPFTARLFGSTSVPQSGLSILGDFTLAIGENWFWVTADLSRNAIEGNRICATLTTYKTETSAVTLINEVSGSRVILLNHRLLYSGGDDASRNYRIPALLCTTNGTLIAATDKRCTGPDDLPGDMDIVLRRSTNNGRSWERSLVIAGEGTDSGFSAPCLVQNRKNKEIICLIAGNKGFFGSSASNPIRIYQSVSKDLGLTWSLPADITRQVYGEGCPNAITSKWQGAFITSGTAIQLKSGRLMAGLVVRETPERDISTFVIFSDDLGVTWQASPGRASGAGNEATLVELDNGNILMSIRTKGTRMFNISKDQGMTWEIPYAQPAITDPSCNGALIRYSSFSDGFDRNRLLHSIPFANDRSNNSVLVSYDEGSTWPVRKTIYPGPSAYSSLCVLTDGTIGMYYEVGEYETYQMYFARFSMSWLTDGADQGIGSWRRSADFVPDQTANTSKTIIYPNPATEILNVSGSFKPGTLIEIFSVNGICLETILIKDASMNFQISLAGYQPGIYLIKLGEERLKFIVR
jgi:hypothetical protein